MAAPSRAPFPCIWVHSPQCCVGAARVKPRAMLCRRGLIATTMVGGATWLSGRLSFLVACRGRVGSKSGFSAFAAVGSDLSFPRTIGKACWEALPAVETSQGYLMQVGRGDLQAEGRDWSSAGALAHAIRERSRDDFRDGWMLSLTEACVYALAALLPQQRKTVE